MDKIMEWNEPSHPYLSGNFAPIRHDLDLTPCNHTGDIPDELTGGQYVRNGGNPSLNEDLKREAHWFDGDGMLNGVVFRRAKDGSVSPEYVSRYILTDVYLAALASLSFHHPIVPSIATLINPHSSLFHIFGSIFRLLLIVILSYLPGSTQVIKRISVANTNVLYHDGRALATCESGPPMRVVLPHLDTVGWFDGLKVEGEIVTDEMKGESFAKEGNLNLLDGRTTAHPRVDPITKELILFHSTFFAPFVYYSVIPSTYLKKPGHQSPRLINVPVPGVYSAKMMHDMGISRKFCVIMDLPLSLDPLNLARNKQVVSYDPSEPSRFGVFPRLDPGAIRWFETEPCCIFHTANTWDEMIHSDSLNTNAEIRAVNMLACRLTSAAVVYSAGNIVSPFSEEKVSSINSVKEEQCRLYYYRFLLSETLNIITHQFALSSIQFEFPTLRQDISMSEARYIYGCSLSDKSFGAALGGAAKIDCLVKMDALSLIKCAHDSPPTPVTGCVDNRTIAEIIHSGNEEDLIKVFKLPKDHYAQEPCFVPRRNGKREDDGWLLSYVFDESQLDSQGHANSDSKSELWVIDAINMKQVVCKIQLPQRVPYGLHGHWFSEQDIVNQRPIDTTRIPKYESKISESNLSVESIRRSVLGLIR
ncbi:Carotenoid 9,10-cleavage dioxygenase 1 [Golovinomyces cichoracearum]|uniref:Carotenoid 9,10-cleavage dioxygenase 1 n=1 Tax=Golovinomyces cichoracearum TaxID=62708 RepID=A0A420H6U4_9PEZI|nr:Carotenoid 9,10-cleavage dioxygenase 1 [Golovinomyces cichoracearum]